MAIIDKKCLSCSSYINFEETIKTQAKRIRQLDNENIALLIENNRLQSLVPKNRREKVEVKVTARGFDLIEFEDDNGEKCSLQKSSSALEDKIWLGIDQAKILEFYPMPRDTNESWFEISKEEVEEKLKHRPQNEIHYRNQRMHLTRELVKELLPHLQKFVETGDI